jgi:hypothetical protein
MNQEEKLSGPKGKSAHQPVAGMTKFFNSETEQCRE